jgi:helicase
MTEKYDIGPGDIRAKVDTAEWIVYAMRELARLLRLDCVADIDRLHRRIQDGIKEELLELVKLRGIGRVRARVLHNSGYTSLVMLAGAGLASLSRLPKIGPKVAEAILAQLGTGRSEKSPEESSSDTARDKKAVEEDPVKDKAAEEKEAAAKDKSTEEKEAAAKKKPAEGAAPAKKASGASKKDSGSGKGKSYFDD